MGDVVFLSGQRDEAPHGATTTRSPASRVCLRECARRAELVVHVARALAAATADEPRIALSLRSQGGPIEDREWTVVSVVNGGAPRRVHGPVRSDDVDMLAGCVAASAGRWADALRRRLRFEAV
jgi:hypothetical protein